MAKISIIVPVYNVQEYISRCLDSILAQSFTDFEVICVDDGSTDLSGDICDRYADKDSRIKVFHIANQGVSNARNYGLDRICGEWFAFIDADDWVEECYLEVLYSNAVKNGCSVSACNFQQNKEYVLGCDMDNVRTVFINSPEECIRNFICSRDSMQGMIWNKLYRSDMYNKIRFDSNVKVNEDCLYTYEVLKECEKACYCSVRLYHWFFRAESACHSKNIKKDFEAANVFLELYKKTEALKDEEVSKRLKRNYVCAVIKVLLYAKYKMSDADVVQSKKQCRAWKKDVWPMFSIKEKLKYVLVVSLPHFW